MLPILWNLDFPGTETYLVAVYLVEVNPRGGKAKEPAAAQTGRHTGPAVTEVPGWTDPSANG